MTSVAFKFELPSGSGESKAINKVSPLTKANVIPAGEPFFAYKRREKAGLSVDEDKSQQDAHASSSGAQDNDGEDPNDTLGLEQESRAVLTSDPKEWKSLDHYAVLGLGELRWKATPEQIKKAHHRKVIRHHPDKKAMVQGGANTNDDSFFKCIAKSMEVLSNPEKRRQFDSVDPSIEESIPTAGETTDENFFELWAPVFDRESRFSKKQPVPALGGPDASKTDVENFYGFYYNFDSWRSFEYLDKDAPEGADSRAEKRYQENKNRNERSKRKKDDIVRLRDAIDLAISLDPRMKAFKAADKAARDARKKNAGVVSPAEKKKQIEEQEAAQKAAEAKAAEEQAQKDADAKASRESAKKAREAEKKTLKRDKKVASTAATEANYFAPAGSLPEPAAVAGVLGDIDALWETLSVSESAAVKAEVEAASGSDAVKTVLVKALADKAPGKAQYLK